MRMSATKVGRSPITKDKEDSLGQHPQEVVEHFFAYFAALKAKGATKDHWGSLKISQKDSVVHHEIWGILPNF